MATATIPSTRPRYYGLFWRWHFFAALIVIPFVLWQSATGTIYLWSERWMDQLHPALRSVAPDPHNAPPGAQIAAALSAVKEDVSKRSSAATHRNMETALKSIAMPRTTDAVLGILLPDDPKRSTTVLLQSRNGLAYPLFVNPHTAKVLGTLSPAEWLPGWSRSLHGGWPLGDAGSWLLELGDCWAIVMIITGFYLWWPRGRPFPEVLWPRSGRGLRILVRDLHSTVAVLFSAIFLFFLVSALPWTSFWGKTLLPRVEAMIGQTSPAGFSMGGASPDQVLQSGASLDEAVRAARARGVKGTLDIRLSPWEGAGWWLANVRTLAPDHTLQAAPDDGHIISDVTNPQLPAIPRFVAFGIHVHQGDFGPVNLWLNTLFAFSLVWLTITGAASWWMRRPRGQIAPPPRTNARWSLGLKIGAAAMCMLLPVFGLSVIAVSAGEWTARRLVPATKGS